MRRADRAFAIATLASLAIVVLGPLQRRIELIGEDDLSGIWAGPRAIATGHDPYDPETWRPLSVALGTQLFDTPVYIYPPWVAVPLLPLGFLPLPVVSILWLVASLAAALLALRYALRLLLPARTGDHAVAPVALLLSWVGILTLVLGQWGYLLVAALFTAVLAVRSGHAMLAGLAALAFLAKPQLFLLAAPAFAVHALWPERPGGPPSRTGLRAVGIALAGALTLLAAGWILLPSWWPTWAQIVLPQQTRPFSDTVPALLVTIIGGPGLVLAPIVVLVFTAVALQFHPRGLAWMAVWPVLSLLAAPYTNSYDQILLIVPVLLAAGVLHARDPGRSRAVLRAGAAVLLVATPVMYWIALMRHSETFGAIVSLTIFAIVTASLWRYRRDPTA